LEESTFPPIEVVRPDDDKLVAKWLTKESERTGLPLHGGGHGSLLRVEGDEVVAFLPRVYEETIASLRSWFAAQSAS